MGVNQYIEEIERLAELLHLFGRAEVYKAVDSGRFGREVVMQCVILPVPNYQNTEFAAEQLR